MVGSRSKSSSVTTSRDLRPGVLDGSLAKLTTTDPGKMYSTNACILAKYLHGP